MLTAGLDLAAAPERTALASIVWTGTRAVVQEIASPAGDPLILDRIRQAAKTGIDCPLGWPDAFVSFVADHHAGRLARPAAGLSEGWRRGLTLRRTDIWVHETFHLMPLSVSADRIAHVALRCAVLLAELGAPRVSPPGESPPGPPIGWFGGNTAPHRPASPADAVDRSGAGPVVEVYPAASLLRWDLRHRGYKRPRTPDVLDALTDHLLAAAPWLDCGGHETVIRRSHDAFDAVIAALTARAASLGLTFPPAPADLPAARAEGWIAVPRAPLSALLLEPSGR